MGDGPEQQLSALEFVLLKFSVGVKVFLNVLSFSVLHNLVFILTRTVTRSTTKESHSAYRGGLFFSLPPLLN